MKNIEELKNIHKGEDIWVLGSGPSLNYINKNFFENKITIGVNRICKFFDCNYIVSKDSRGFENILNYKSAKSKIIISKYNCGNPGSVLNKINIEHFIFSHTSKKDNKPNISIIKKNSNEIVVSHSTITSAIHIAAFMGASNIMICGHDCGTIDGYSQINNYNKDFNKVIMKGENYLKWLNNLESQTKTVIDAITKEYSCNVYSLNPFLNLNATGYKYVHSSNYFYIKTALKDTLKFYLRKLKDIIINLEKFFF